jgi:DMSO reductase family type II enzyme chaperone
MSSQPRALRRVHDRDTQVTAPPRCACYAAWSELTASPHDLDPRPGLLARLGSWEAIPHAGNMAALIRDYANTDLDTLKQQYSGLFEVGSDGPPLPIREDLVRFYDFFGYRLADRFAWAPDHLSVELEFMHFLCYGEATNGAEPESFQFAQLDFTERHLARWVPQFAAATVRLAGDGLYGRVMTALAEFVRADHAWQSGTISGAG